MTTIRFDFTVAFLFLARSRRFRDIWATVASQLTQSLRSETQDVSLRNDKNTFFFFFSYLVAPSLAFSYQCLHCPMFKPSPSGFFSKPSCLCGPSFWILSIQLCHLQLCLLSFE